MTVMKFFSGLNIERFKEPDVRVSRGTDEFGTCREETTANRVDSLSSSCDFSMTDIWMFSRRVPGVINNTNDGWFR